MFLLSGYKLADRPPTDQYRNRRQEYGYEGTRICHLKIPLFNIKVILSWRQLRVQAEKNLSSPHFSALRQDINSFTGEDSRLYQPREGTGGICRQSYSISFLPRIYLPALSCPWKPEMAFLRPVVSLQTCCSLFKRIYKLSYISLRFLPCDVHRTL